MNKLNTLFEAMNDIDDNIASNAIAARRRRPIALIVAAAAAMMLLVGFVSANRHGTFSLGTEHMFDYTLKKYDITIPDEYKPCEENMYNYAGVVDTGVVELFEKFNAPLLINQNFSADIDTEAADIVPWTYSNMNTGAEEEVKGVPFINVFSYYVDFAYYLYDKNIDRNINFWAMYLTADADDDFGVFDGVDSTAADNSELVKLNDGSDCFVGAGYAEFSYNGVKYSIDLGYGERTVDLTKQVLTDLGVL